MSSLLYIHTSATPPSENQLSSVFKFKGIDAIVAQTHGATIVEFDPESQTLAKEPVHVSASYSKADTISNLEHHIAKPDNAVVVFSAGPTPNEPHLVASFVKAVEGKTGKPVNRNFSASSSFIFVHHKSMNFFVYDTNGGDAELQLEYSNGQFLIKKQVPPPVYCTERPSSRLYLRYAIFLLFLVALVIAIGTAFDEDEEEDGNVVYLSDIRELSSRNVHGGIGKDKVYWTTRRQGILLRDGAFYTKGIVQHPPEHGESRIVYSLNKSYSKFRATIGHVDPAPSERDSGFAYRFRVVVDGNAKYTSKTFAPGSTHPEDIEIDVSKADTLILETKAFSNVGMPHFCAHSVWASARLINK